MTVEVLTASVVDVSIKPASSYTTTRDTIPPRGGVAAVSPNDRLDPDLWASLGAQLRVYQNPEPRACRSGVAVPADGHLDTALALRPFDEFYRAEYAGVVRLAVALAGRRDVAEELAQEAFVAAYRRWSRVATLDDPAGWVRRVATNRCVSSGRRYITELRLLRRLHQERGAPDPDDRLEDDDLWAAVRSLPRRQAQVMALAFVEDRSVADIAELLGCGQETVRTHLRRGRHTVAQRLGLQHPNEDGGGRRG